MYRAEVVNVYGITEATSTVASGDIRDEQQRRNETIGRPYSGMEFRIVDDAGAPVAVGVMGELQVRGWSIMHGYLQVHDVADPVTSDGWLATGDLGALDQLGYFRYMGRRKDVVRTGGENVSALEVENYLKRHAAVSDAAVIGVPDPRWTEIVVAYVQLHSPGSADEETLRQHCREGVASFKVPKRVEVIAEFPLTGSGKISKPALREIELAPRLEAG